MIQEATHLYCQGRSTPATCRSYSAALQALLTLCSDRGAELCSELTPALVAGLPAAGDWGGEGVRDDESFEGCPESGGCAFGFREAPRVSAAAYLSGRTAGWQPTGTLIVKVPAPRSDEWGWSAF